MKPASAGLVLALAGLAVEAHAVGRLADVEIVDRSSGAVLETHYCRGEYWVAGTPGARYSIAIRNARGERLLAVTAVDGVNVISGETAAFGQSGYVFAPGQGYEISGWRKSNQEIAAFEFTAAPQSYAERTGRPANVGVIGVALFLERPRPVLYGGLEPAPGAPERRADTDAPASAGRAESGGAPAASLGKSAADAADAAGAQRSLPAPAPKLGTGHGAREQSWVENTEFERLSSRPNEVIRIRYDSLENLIAMGVVRPRAPQPPRPNAFPDSPASGYVPDPPGYPAYGLR